MKKITLFVIIFWAAISVSVAAISIPTISSDVGKTPALAQDSVKKSNGGNSVDGSTSNSTNITKLTNQDQEKNNNSAYSHSGQLMKKNSFKSVVKHDKNKIKTKHSSKKNKQKA